MGVIQVCEYLAEIHDKGYDVKRIHLHENKFRPFKKTLNSSVIKIIKEIIDILTTSERNYW